MELLVYELNEKNYYVIKGAKTINITSQYVDKENYNEVEYLNAFTERHGVGCYDELERVVLRHVGTNNLHGGAYNDLVNNSILNLSKDRINEVIKRIENMAGNRELYILANFKEIYYEEGNNMFDIISKDGSKFKIALILSRIGEIVG